MSRLTVRKKEKNEVEELEIYDWVSSINEEGLKTHTHNILEKKKKKIHIKLLSHLIKRK